MLLGRRFHEHQMSAAAAAILCLSSCVVYTTGPVRHDSRSVRAGRVREGPRRTSTWARQPDYRRRSAEAAECDFTYNVASVGARGSVQQHGHPGGNSPSASRRATPRSVTQVRMGPGVEQRVPMDLTVHFGAGNARSTWSLSLRSVDVHMGVGKLDMDLRGNPKQQLRRAGSRRASGRPRVRLRPAWVCTPKVRAASAEIKTQGLRAEGGHLGQRCLRRLQGENPPGHSPAASAPSG